MKHFNQCGIRHHYGMLYRKGKALSLFLLLLILSVSGQVFGQTGIAPTDLPPAGFGIDGDGTPNVGTTNPPINFAGTADWWKTGSSENYILEFDEIDGIVLNQLHPEYVAHSRTDDDPWGGVDPTIFTSSTKVNDPYGTTFTFGPGRVPNKNEINRSTVHFSFDDDIAHTGEHGDLWCVFSADRQVNNGEAYIDFEFLQAPLYPVYNPAIPGTGYFQSDGTDGTRTEGDILVTIMFTNGGTVPTPVIQRWENPTNTPTGWTYVTKNLSSYTNQIYMTSNQVSITPLWQPYGNASYLPNQFAEGAINLSAIMGFSSTSCGYISTVFCRTKTSQSPTAELKDFPGMPYQVNIGTNQIIVQCPAAASVPACSTDQAIQNAYSNWRSGFSYTGGVEPITENIGDLPENINLAIYRCGGTINFTYSVDDNCESAQTCSSSFTVGTPAAVVINKPANFSASSCDYASQEALNSAFNTWLAGFTVSGGCSPIGDYGSPQAPALCTGGTTSVTYNVTDRCFTGSQSATFTITVPVSITYTAPQSSTVLTCGYTDQAALETAFNAWITAQTNAFNVQHGCNPQVSNDGASLDAPVLCTGGSTTVNWFITDLCQSIPLSATFTVTAPASLTYNEPQPSTVSACAYASQAALETAFNAWVTAQTNALHVQHGCNPQVSNDGSTLDAPELCAGGSTTVHWVITDLCETKNLSSTFTVTAPAAITYSAPQPSTVSACAYANQAALETAFNAWVTAQTNSLSVQPGCNPQVSTDGNTLDAPGLCAGGSTTVHWTITDLCETINLSSTFTVTAPAAITYSAPQPSTVSACAYANQAALETAFNAWVTAQTNALNVQHGCNPQVSNDGSTLDAPGLCAGGSTTVHWAITDLCETINLSSTFTVTAPAAITYSAPQPSTVSACAYVSQASLETAFNAWVTAQTNALNIQHGCNPQVTNDGASLDAPVLCTGGSTTVHWSITDLCQTIPLSAAFTVTAPAAITYNDPQPSTVSACGYVSQAALETAFNAWVTAQTNALNIQHGCNPQVTNDGASLDAPVLCTGGSTTVHWSITDLCQSIPLSAAFTVTAPAAITYNDPQPSTVSACGYASQTALETAFNAWVTAQTNALNIQHGCNPQVTNDGASLDAPALCTGGSTTVHWSITDLCQSIPLSAAFTVTAPATITYSAPQPSTVAACAYANQAALETAFNAWVTAQTNALNIQHGCNPQVINDGGSLDAPVLCTGGSTTVHWSITDLCQSIPLSAAFTVTAPAAITYNDPQPSTVSACGYVSQAALETAFNAWVTAQTNALNIQNGCNPQVTNDGASLDAPALCTGGSTTVHWSITDLCQSIPLSAAFTVTAPAAITYNDPQPSTVSACGYASQAALETAFNAWVTAQTNALNIQHGCNPQVINDGSSLDAPILCTGGSTTVHWTITDLCQSIPLTAVFTVTTPASITYSAPQPSTVSACAYINQAALETAFNNWVALQTSALNIHNGCNPQVTTDGDNLDAPVLCSGGNTTVNWTITDLCETIILSADFSVIAPDPVEVTPVSDLALHACDLDDQEAANQAFEEWLNGFLVSGGCNPIVENNAPAAPSYCGGSTTVTWIISDLCLGQVQHSATFTIIAPDPIQVTEVDDISISSCAFTDQSQAAWAFEEWLDDFQVSGGCSPGISIGSRSIGIDAPNYCGGSTTVTWVVTDHCYNATEFTATFTITQPDPVVVTEVDDQTINACVYHNQNEAESAFFEWLNDFSVSGGCAPQFYNGMPEAPYYCGGSAVVTWTVTDQCYNTSDHTATFTILAPSNITVHVPGPVNMPACSSQSQIDLAYSDWLAEFSYEGGCHPYVSQSIYGDVSELHCGGSILADLMVSDDCNGYDYNYSTFSVAYPTAITATAPTDPHLPACTSYNDALAAFNLWKAGFTFRGGCDVEEGFFTYPSLSDIMCGGTIYGYYDVWDECLNYDNASSTFTIGAPTPINASGPGDITLSACTSYADALELYNDWITGFSFTGGCNAYPILDIDGTLEDIMCGGTLQVGYYVLGDCGGYDDVYAYFTIEDPSYPQAFGPQDQTIAACTAYSSIQAAYTAWLGQFGYSGGCNTSVISNPPSLPEGIECGGNVTYNYYVMADCGYSAEVTRDFTVLSPAVIEVNCPAPVEITACSSTMTLIQAAYDNWVAGFSFSGGCNSADNSDNIPDLPSDAACNGAILDFTYSVISTCEEPVTCQSHFYVAQAPELIVYCSNNVSLPVCSQPMTIQDQYETWAAGFHYSGGCNASDNIDELPSLPADLQCGVSLSFTYTVISDCENPEPCTRTFIVAPDDTPPSVNITSMGYDLGCDPLYIPNCEDISFEANDNCGEPLVDCDYEDTFDGISWSRVITVTATDACGNTDSDDITYTWTQNCLIFCSLTQGFYGNAGGSYCDGTSTWDLLTELLTTPLYIGSGSNIITVPTNGQQCVIDKLPGSGGSSVLTGSYSLCNVPHNWLKNGVLKNSLLAQTITLGLNLRLDTELSGLEFTSATFFTRASSSCNNPTAYPILGTEHYYTMPQSIMAAFGGSPTVQQIYDLANQALGGGSNMGCSLGDINAAVGNINSGLDMCRFIYFTAPPVSSPTPGNNTSTTFNTSTIMQGTEEAIMTIVPNPFQQSTEIRYRLSTDSRISLEVYNLYGTKVATLFEGEAKAGFDYTYRFDPVGNNSEQVFLVVLRTNFGTVTKRIINTY